VELRKTEYIVRSSSSPFSFASRSSRRPAPRRPRQRLGAWWQAVLRAVIAVVGHRPWARPQAHLNYRLAGGVGGGLLALLLLGTVTLQITYAGRVLPGVHVLGVDLGGKTREEAQVVLAERLRQLEREPLVFQYEDREWRTTLAELGLRLEVEALAEAAYAAGRQGNLLARLFSPLSGLLGRPTPPALALAFDEARLGRYLDEVARAVDRPERNARLAIDPEGRVQYTPAETGRRLNADRTREQLRAVLLAAGALVVPLVVDERAPAVTDADLAPVRAQAERLLAGPVVLRLGAESWNLEPAQLAAAIEFEGPPDRPTAVRVKEAGLEQAVRALAKRIDQTAMNARFEFAGGQLRVLRESREGREVDIAATVAAVRQALESAERVVDLPARITQPAVTTEQRDRLGIRELIARGETRVAGSSPPKLHNIKLAASRLHGVVVPPGAVFSFNRELGPTTLEAGYQVGWGIAAIGDGSHATVPSVAGGICQVATTLFQPVFWAGYQIEERHPHLYWIPAYGVGPLGRVGLDATVDEDAGLDFRFLNSSPDYVLIQTAVDDTTLTISLYGNKPGWTVKVEGPTITNRKAARQEVVYYPEPTLPWGQRFHVESAGDGFDATLVRTVIDGENVRTLTLRTHYEPSQNLVVVGVRGAPPGALEEIRAANARAAATTTPASSETPSAAATATPAAPASAVGTSAPTAAPATPATRQSPLPTAAAAGPLPPTSGPSAPESGRATAVAAPPTTAPAPTAAGTTAAPAPATAVPTRSAPTAAPTVSLAPQFGAPVGPRPPAGVATPAGAEASGPAAPGR